MYEIPSSEINVKGALTLTSDKAAVLKTASNSDVWVGVPLPPQSIGLVLMVSTSVSKTESKSSTLLSYANINNL